MWGIEGSITSAVEKAPEAFIKGLVGCLKFVPEKFIGFASFGANIWAGMTPEQKKTIEDAVRKAIIAGAEAYVKKSS